MTDKDYVMRLLLAANRNEALIKEILGAAGDVGDFTLEEIGNILGITRERVRQIEAVALKKLKHPRVGRKLNAYLNIPEQIDICVF